MLCTAFLLAAGPVFADDLRDFHGTISGVSGKSLSVQNRMGDRRSFARAKDTRVSGRRKAWSELQGGDEVVVSWSLRDSKPRARRVNVVGTK